MGQPHLVVFSNDCPTRYLNDEHYNNYIYDEDQGLRSIISCNCHRYSTISLEGVARTRWLGQKSIVRTVWTRQMHFRVGGSVLRSTTRPSRGMLAVNTLPANLVDFGVSNNQQPATGTLVRRNDEILARGSWIPYGRLDSISSPPSWIPAPRLSMRHGRTNSGTGSGFIRCQIEPRSGRTRQDRRRRGKKMSIHGGEHDVSC